MVSKRFFHVFSSHNGKENANQLIISTKHVFKKICLFQLQPSLLDLVPRISGESWALWPLIPAFQQLAMRLRLDGRFEAAWWFEVFFNVGSWKNSLNFEPENMFQFQKLYLAAGCSREILFRYDVCMA